MDFLTQQEVSGIRQDIRHGEAKQFAGKNEFEKKLLGGLGQDMEETLEHPDKKKDVKFAKKYTRKKKRRVWKENFMRIFVGNKKRETD